MTPLKRAALRRWAQRMRPRYEAALRRLVEIPTVSADPARRPDIERAALAAAELIRELGGTASVQRTRGNTTVLGAFEAGRSAPVVTLYNHLDVQPADREKEGWRTAPFVFTRKADRYFGRGTTDDKGPALAALFGVAAAREAGVPATARLLWESEEEIGSPNLESLVRRRARHLTGHSVVVSDSSWLNRSHPSSIVGRRGFVGFRFLLETADGEAHSGDVGGAARNPLGELMQLASQLHDARTGRVRVPGSYDDVPRLSAAERRDFVRSGFSLAAYRRDNRLRRLRTTDTLGVLERIWARRLGSSRPASPGAGALAGASDVPGRRRRSSAGAQEEPR